MICPCCNHNNVPGRDQCENCQQDLSQLDRPVAQDRVERSLMDDPVSTLTPRSPITLPPTATLGEAVQTMLRSNIGAIPIVDETGRLLGILSERDVMLEVAGTPSDLDQRLVTERMTPRPETVRQSDTLAFALHKMGGGGYRHLPVLSDGRLIGMISVRDVLRHITRLCGAC